ncbi:MAG: hypothetical protein EBT09_04800, partial [Actinobacteria bacterium]|nr:hypothetical protein [Actinomycetota bacterium]
MLAHVFPSRRLTFLTPRARSAPANARSLSAGDRTGCAHRVYGAWRSAVRADPLREDATRPGCGLRPRPPGTGCGANAVSQGETRLGDGTAGSGTCPVPRAPCYRTVHGPREDVSGHGRITLGNRGHIGAFAGRDADVERHHEQPAWTPPWDWSTRGTPEVWRSVTVRTPPTGTHATPGHRDAQEVRGREPPPDPRMHWLPARCIRVMAGASARRCACLHGADVSSARKIALAVRDMSGSRTATPFRIFRIFRIFREAGDHRRRGLAGRSGRA